VTTEPDMENLLASIRKAINSDLSESSQLSRFAPPPAQPFKGSMQELRVKFENNLAKANDAANDIAELRSKINRNRTADAIIEPSQSHAPSAPVSPPRNGFAAILAGDLAARGPTARPVPAEPPPSLRPTLQEREPSLQTYDEPEATGTGASWHEEEQSYLPVVHEGYADYQAEPLMSERPAMVAKESFNQLADTLMARALGERSIEDMTQDLLRGMLKNWLDAHLPNLVERLVREEIERVARRGR